SESFDKFYFNWDVDVSFIVCVGQKFADSSPSGLTIIASKFIYVHADKLVGELCTHVARVSKRMTHGVISMRQAVIDTLANDFAEIVPDWWRDIFADHIGTKRQRQAGFALPPLSEIHNLLKTGLRVGQLPFVYD